MFRYLAVAFVAALTLLVAADASAQVRVRVNRATPFNLRPDVAIRGGNANVFVNGFGHTGNPVFVNSFSHGFGTNTTVFRVGPPTVFVQPTVPLFVTPTGIVPLGYGGGFGYTNGFGYTGGFSTFGGGCGY